jgi:hypothetical protein
MSNALAISAVSAVLQYYLGNSYNNGLGALFGGTVKLTSQAPDLVQSNLPPPGSQQNQVNVFLHQVTHNAAWRNVGLASLAADGKTQLKNPPLALDLHYLLTAYGSDDWQAEALLGYGLLLFHQNPVLARDDIRNALNALPANPLSPLLRFSGLADQIEMIRITPATLGREEMAWLWTALKADYRPTYPFQVSVVLLQEPANVAIPWPVMKRHIQAVPTTPALLLGVQPPNNQPAALPGDTVTITGESLAGASQVTLSNQLLGIQKIVALPLSAVTNASLTFPVPNDALNFPAGAYSLSVQFLDSSGNIVQTSNSIPLAVAPAVDPLSSFTAVANVVDTIPGTLVKIACNPYAWPMQSVLLALSSTAVPGMAVPALTFESPANALSFQFTPAVPSGSYVIRLLVDGVASLVTWQKHPPLFTGPKVTV